MSDLYLIAHKVRGKPAFDVATRMRCSICDGIGGYKVPDFETGEITDYEGPSCHECDGLGYWWIIPTSGHRAYPWRWWPLANLRYESCAEVQDYDVVQPMDEIQNGIPDEVPDHYTTRAAPTVGLADMLGLTIKRAPAAPIKRRF